MTDMRVISLSHICCAAFATAMIVAAVQLHRPARGERCDPDRVVQQALFWLNTRDHELVLDALERRLKAMARDGSDVSRHLRGTRTVRQQVSAADQHSGMSTETLRSATQTFRQLGIEVE